MAGFQGSGSSTSGGFAPQKSKSSPSIFGKALHIANAVMVQPNANLLKDVTTAVTGLPMGLVSTVEHPIRAGDALVHTTWHTWSPLFHGDFQKFGKQVYDHPLAPLLDIASVFSLGLGSAAKAADLSIGATGVARVGTKLAAGEKLNGLGENLSALRMHKTLTLEGNATLNKTGKGLEGQRTFRTMKDLGVADRGEMTKVLSRRPSRRLGQEALIKLDQAGHLPDWYVKGRYERAALVKLSHNVAATKEATHMALKKEASIAEGTHPVLHGSDPGLDVLAAHSLMYRVILRAGKTLSDGTDLGKRARTSTFVGLYSGLVRHNKAYHADRAAQLVKDGHHGYIVDPSYYDRKYWTRMKWARRQHARATQDRAATIEMHAPKLERNRTALGEATAEVQGLAKTEADLVKANEQLRQYHAQGHTISGGARRTDGSNRLITNPTKKQLMNYEAADIHALQENIKVLTKKRERALKAQKKIPSYERRIQESSDALAQAQARVTEKEAVRVALEDRSVDDLFAAAGDTHDAFVKHVDQFGSARKGALTKNADHALRDTNGNLYIAPYHDAHNLSIEGGNSVKLLRTIVHKPTQFWKDMTIKYTPRTVMNNGIGNWLMYSLTNMGPGGVQAFGNALRHEFGSEVLGSGHNLYSRNHWSEINHLSDLADNFGVGQSVIKSDVFDEATGRVLKRAVHMEDLGTAGKIKAQGFYGVVAKTSERPVRLASLYHTYSAMPEVKAELAIARKEGLQGRRALDTAITRATKKNYGLVEEASLAQRRVAGDYLSMSAGEKWLKDIIPFYLWNRHILKNTGNILLDNPARLAVGARLGGFGIAETEQYAGAMPDFLKGAIPLAALGLGDRTGRMNFLYTASLNPYATVGELADTLNAWTAGDVRRGAAVSQFNPLIVGTFESVFQTSALTGVPSPRTGGILADVVGRTASQFPYVKTAKVIVDGDRFKTPKGNDFLFAKTKKGALTSIAGLPIKDTSVQRMNELADQLDKKKTKGGHGFAG